MKEKLNLQEFIDYLKDKLEDSEAADIHIFKEHFEATIDYKTEFTLSEWSAIYCGAYSLKNYILYHCS